MATTSELWEASTVTRSRTTSTVVPPPWRRAAWLSTAAEVMIPTWFWTLRSASKPGWAASGVASSTLATPS